ncbi:hypothetical protein FKR81_34290 [Lentzea tibetensis]|uniref:Uncharacterized protein n=1 Tax=Lentzea tibetensis TaxID=2591470 RepID=A0A563EJE5_9PSEU|nr:hypothetical protein [Lentzea tibetensis]TWP46879.1 hypothetical protein FKR81_34290 [Lentzea tibetensis]
MRWKACAITVLLVVAGCGGKAPLGLVQTIAPPVWADPNCPPPDKDPLPGGEQVTRGSIPDGFATTWVLRCRTEVREIQGKGEWTIQIAERSDTNAQELVDQLRRPSDGPTASACTMELVVPPYFLLVDAAGRAVLPQVPVDSCGKPRIEARKALEALPFRTIAETPVVQVQSQQSMDAGCSESYKDLIAIEASSAEPGPATPIWRTAVGAIGVCVYETQQEVGKFVAGHTIRDDAAKSLLAALDNAVPAAVCTAQHTKFALLSVPGEATSVVVELDGCRRLLRPDQTVGQLDESVIAMIRTT